MSETSSMKRTSVHTKNMWIKQLCNHKVLDFAMAFRVRKLFGTFEKRARHYTFLSTQECKWVLANCGGNVTNCDGLASRLGVVEILQAASCYGNRDELRQVWASQLQGFTYGKFWLRWFSTLERENRAKDWVTSCLRIAVSYLCGNIGTSSGSTFPDIPPLRSAKTSTAYKHRTKKNNSLCLILHGSVAEYHLTLPCNTLSQSLELVHVVRQIVSSSLLCESEFFPCTPPKIQAGSYFYTWT